MTNNKKMNPLYVDDKSFDEFVDMLKTHKIMLDNFIYGSSAPSNHADYEALPKILQTIHSYALDDLRRLINTLNYLKRMQGYKK